MNKQAYFRFYADCQCFCENELERRTASQGKNLSLINLFFFIRIISLG